MPTVFHQPEVKTAIGPAMLSVATILSVRKVALDVGLLAFWLISPADAYAPAVLIALAAFVISLFKKTLLHRAQYWAASIALAALMAVTVLGMQPLPWQIKIALAIALGLLLIAADPILDLVTETSNWKKLRETAAVITGIYRSPRTVAWATEICTDFGVCAMAWGVFGLIVRWNGGGAAAYLAPAFAGFVTLLVGRVLIPEIKSLEFSGPTPAPSEPWDDFDDDD